MVTARRRSGVACSLCPVAWLVAALTLATGCAAVQSDAQGKAHALQPLRAGTGTALQLQMHSKAIEGSLAGDSPLRDVSVYLPPSYGHTSRRRYPVLYMLHGSGGTHLSYFQEGASTHIPSIADRTLQKGVSREMIIVAPNGNTLFGGSNFSSGATTGDFETFVARELVEFIDANFRTIPQREARGLAGHSMGGYGTLRIGMKHPDVYSAIYVLSSCCIGAASNLSTDAAVIAKFEDWYRNATAMPTSGQQIPSAIRTSVQAAVAWAPNPKRPPLYFDIPFQSGAPIKAVVDRMTANRPLAMVDQYIGNLRKLVIAFDVGDRDFNIAANLAELDRILAAYQVPHSFEIYSGDHNDRIPERFESKVMPFFSQHFARLPDERQR